MSGKPFDATTKDLIQKHPKDWLDFLGLPAARVSVVDADLSTVSLESDKLLVVDANPPYIAHLELQSTYKQDDASRFLGYNVLAGARHDLLVETVAILLRPEADGACMHGPLVRAFPGKPPYLQFEFRTVRIWELPVDLILRCGVGLLPLAPLCDVRADALPDVIRQMDQRITASASDEAAALWTSTYILMGLRFPRELAGQLLKGVRAMKESSTYQAILEEGEAKGEAKGRVEGRVEGEQSALLRLGTKRFGEPDADTVDAVQTTTSIERLEQLIERVLEVESWAELLE